MAKTKTIAPVKLGKVWTEIVNSYGRPDILSREKVIRAAEWAVTKGLVTKPNYWWIGTKDRCMFGPSVLMVFEPRKCAVKGASSWVELQICDASVVAVEVKNCCSPYHRRRTVARLRLR